MCIYLYYCRPFTKNRERVWKFRETGDSKYIYQNELDKTCFQYDMAYGDFKDLPRRTTTDKALHKAFTIVKNPKFDRYQRGLASMVYMFFDEKTAVGADKNEIVQNNELAEELHKSVIRKFEKSTLMFYRLFLECWFSWYAIVK